ncbi:DUF2737 family protein [Pseudocitrobacter faecalis]|nr:DUF2737 family protein [Pseudocitrobacter faecalis]
MLARQYDPSLTPGELVARQRIRPYPSREELLARNSFPSVNENKYLNARLPGVKK